MTTTNAHPMSAQQQTALKALIEEGLPLDSRPYATLAQAIGSDENSVILTISRWLSEGLIKRWGIVVKHHSVGYTANAMIVWDVPDAQVDDIGERIKASGLVSLCYRRPRRAPYWNYNLFCMIHGKNREEVTAQIDKLTFELQLQHLSRNVLFSYRQYKQCGGHFLKRDTSVASRPEARLHHG